MHIRMKQSLYHLLLTHQIAVGILPRWFSVNKAICPRKCFILFILLTCISAPHSVISAVPGSTTSDIPEKRVVHDPDTLDSGTGGCIDNDWHLGLNVIAAGMGVLSLTGEYDLNSEWSVAISAGYSAWNYGSSQRKFRTLFFRPEGRWWFAGHEFFIEGHAALYYYNFALERWHYRIQDANGSHPALGGGIGAGWRHDFNSNWSIQAQAGVGVYYLDYQRFVNKPNGALEDRIAKWRFAADNIGVSVIYTFTGGTR